MVFLMKSVKSLRGMWLSLRHPCVTCTGRNVGAGAQVQSVMSTILFARAHGYNYFHTPFKSMELAPDGDEVAWARAWELSTNLGENELSSSEVFFLKNKSIDSCTKVRWQPLTLFYVQHCHEYADRYPDKYELVLPEFRRRYAKGKRNFTYREPTDQLHVAIHIRRGDVLAKAQAERLTDNSKIENLVRSIQAAFENASLHYQLHIISEGKKSDFGSLCDIQARWHLNSCAIEAFDRLVQADVLVTAKSSFSYVAALLNPRIIIYEPFWHTPMTHWNTINDEGGLAPPAMEHVCRALQQLQRYPSSNQ